MTSSLDSLTGMPMPALSSSTNVGARPNAAAEAAANAAAAADETGAAEGGGGGFHKLMHLQSRGRSLEAKLQSQASGAAADPAARASNALAAATREQFHQLRELVGDAPGGNARRAFAAIVERLEGGGSLKPADSARIRLAIAADQHKVDLPAALRAKEYILAAEQNIDTIAGQAKDPTLVQDPARLAIFREQGAKAREHLERLEQLIQSGKLDQHSLQALDAQQG